MRQLYANIIIGSMGDNRNDSAGGKMAVLRNILEQFQTQDRPDACFIVCDPVNFEVRFNNVVRGSEMDGQLRGIGATTRGDQMIVKLSELQFDSIYGFSSGRCVESGRLERGASRVPGWDNVPLFFGSPLIINRDAITATSQHERDQLIIEQVGAEIAENQELRQGTESLTADALFRAGNFLEQVDATPEQIQQRNRADREGQIDTGSGKTEQIQQENRADRSQNGGQVMLNHRSITLEEFLNKYTPEEMNQFYESV